MLKLRRALGRCHAHGDIRVIVSTVSVMAAAAAILALACVAPRQPGDTAHAAWTYRLSANI